MQSETMERLLKLLTEKTTKQVLIVLFASTQNTKEIQYLLQDCQAFCNYQFIFSPSFKENLADQEWLQYGTEIRGYHEDFQKQLAQFDCVLLPFITRNSLAKLALCIADNFALTVVQQVLLMNKPVYASNHAWQLNHDYAIYRGLNQNPVMTRRFQQYEQNLIDFGMQSGSLLEFKEMVEAHLKGKEYDQKPAARKINRLEKDQTIYTLEDVQKNPKQFDHQSVTLTDLAKEFLQNDKQ
ncbi:hypothetical protein ACS127_05945 [Amphibacillus sp. Q70]|uniref:hypothetical protein n=1 Tax=Amphibacillus sp. Q70 TaxID=3453416 RepID=UPI003F83AD0A